MFKNKEQVMVVPVNYVSNVGNKFKFNETLTLQQSYCHYDSLGVYKPLYEIENNICFIRISTMLIIKNQYNEYLVKELHDKQKRPCLELGIHSYVKSQSGNYEALYNQLIASTKNYFNTDLKFEYLGTIRDLANDNVKSILGNVYMAEINKDDFILKTKHDLYENKWYSKQELIDKYNKATSWSKIMIDTIVEELI